MANTEAIEVWAEALLGKLPKTRIAVCGDFCLDTYWVLETQEIENSLETGLPLHRVREQRFTPGGAGSVVANLCALGVGTVRAIGVVGTDIFAGKLTELLKECDVDLAGWITDPSVHTMVYAKPMLGDRESNRVDFGGFNTYSAALQKKLTAALDKAAGESDVVVLNQQVPGALLTPALAAEINRIIASHPKTLFLVDSRHYAEHFKGVAIKLNVSEVARLLGHGEEDMDAASTAKAASELQARFGKHAFITRGEHGIVSVDTTGEQASVPGLQVIEQTDTVGAGDAVVAAVAASLAAGETAAHAAEFANVAASITVRQLQRTGTASAEQVRAALKDLNYIFRPELADSPRSARYIDGTEIEVIGELPEKLAIKHCIFDHDGTLSVLREGWEHIMEPMMLRAILGKQHDTVDEAVFKRTQETSRQFIDRTTGIQTLVQMKGLVELVRQQGFVPEEEILDEHGYKHLYNVELLKMIARRVEKLHNGELSSEDFQIKNASLLLEELHKRGIKLYLASGTDEADVIAEAEAMGYAHLFEGRIFGAVGDVNVEAKKIVLERIIRENGLSGHEFATFGDGPVELRETQKRGGIAIGVASDELRRFGLNLSKRKRLVRAGANLIVPDYSQLPALLKVLQLA
jgi:rfaE bifunctional protein kinase chain/domain